MFDNLKQRLGGGVIDFDDAARFKHDEFGLFRSGRNRRTHAAAKVIRVQERQRRLPMILGTVTSISPDRITDPRTEQSYFNALISVNREALKPYPDARIIPGMPVEVAMHTGARTALEYFIEPIRAVLRNGMREK